MDPEAIEKKLKELKQTISDEQKKGQRIMELIDKAQKEMQQSAQKILELRGQVMAYQEILNG